MTTVYGSFKRGVKAARLAIEVSGKLSKGQWERFKAELAPVLRKYGIKVSQLAITKQAPKKKAKKKKKSG